VALEHAGATGVAVDSALVSLRLGGMVRHTHPPPLSLSLSPPLPLPSPPLGAARGRRGCDGGGGRRAAHGGTIRQRKRERERDAFSTHVHRAFHGRPYTAHVNVRVANRTNRDSNGWEMSSRRRSRHPLNRSHTSVARTEGCTYATNAWALSVVQGHFLPPRAKPYSSDSQLSHR
jgi:hypothetical protein